MGLDVTRTVQELNTQASRLERRQADASELAWRLALVGGTLATITIFTTLHRTRVMDRIRASALRLRTKSSHRLEGLAYFLIFASSVAGGGGAGFLTLTVSKRWGKRVNRASAKQLKTLATELEAESKTTLLTQGQMKKIIDTIGLPEMARFANFFNFEQAVELRSLVGKQRFAAEVLGKLSKRESRFIGNTDKLATCTDQEWETHLGDTIFMRQLRKHPSIHRDLLARLSDARKAALTRLLLNLEKNASNETMKIGNVKVSRDLMYEVSAVIKSMFVDLPDQKNVTVPSLVQDISPLPNILTHFQNGTIPNDVDLLTYFPILEAYDIGRLLSYATIAVQKKAEREGLEAIRPWLGHDSVKLKLQDHPLVTNVPPDKLEAHLALAKATGFRALRVRCEEARRQQ